MMGPDPHQLVLASAGSGKTYRISSRFIGLLAAAEEPHSILAATFTRKAAGEILDRVLLRLAEATLEESRARELAASASLSDPGRGPQASHDWGGVLERSVAALNRFNVLTLDAFFIRTAAAFYLELGLPPRWSIADQTTLQRLQSSTLEELLREFDQDDLLDLIRLTARGGAPRSVHVDLLRRMEQLIEIREQLDPAAGAAWSAFRAPETGEAPPADEPDRLADEIEACPLPSHHNWKKAVDTVLKALRSRDWPAVAKSSLCHKVALGDYAFSRSPIDPPLRDLLERALDLVRFHLRPQLAAQTEALGRLVTDFERRYRLRQKNAGAYTFGDVTNLLARSATFDQSQLLFYRLDGSIRHLLLDEFQDTSLMQWLALSPILDEVLQDDSRLGVIVADPKQSIYGWRGAEPAVVRAIGEKYALEGEPLNRSFRSSPIVLDFVNRVFHDLPSNPGFGKYDDCRDVAAEWMRDFRPHVANKPELPGYVRLQVGPPDSGRGSTRPELCAFAASEVARLRSEASGCTIGVLTRTNGGVSQIYYELRRLGLDVSQEGGTPLTDSAACEAVLALLRMADHPGDSIVRYHVANSPLGEALNFSDERDLARAATLAADMRERLVVDGYGRTLKDLAERIVVDCDERDARRLGQLVELGYRYDAAATLRPADFVRFVESQRVEDRASADIRVMTIHQAKGLEFDIVVLPQLDDTILPRGFPPVVLPLREESPGLVTGVYPYVAEAVRCLFPDLEPPFRQFRSGVVRDALSTLYVGLTRARYSLHLLVTPDGKSLPSTVSPTMLVRYALAGDEPAPPATPCTTLYEAGDPQWYTKLETPETVAGRPKPREVQPARLTVSPRTRHLPRTSPSALAKETVRARDLLRFDDTAAMARGSLVHAWFEGIEWIEETELHDDLLLETGRRLAPALSASRLAETLADFRGWLDHPNVRHALSRRRYAEFATVHREVPFIRRHEEGLIEGAIDRLVLTRDSDGRVTEAEILDFKTDRVAAPESVDELVKTYRAQLEAYADAVAELYRLPRANCRASLVILEAGAVVDALA